MGWHLFKHLLSRLDPTVRRRRGLKLFQSSFYPEGLMPATALVRDIMPRAERCVTCHLCLAVDVPEGMLSARDLTLRATRSSSDWRHVRAYLAPDESYRAAEPLCPVRIPFVRVAEAIRTAVA